MADDQQGEQPKPPAPPSGSEAPKPEGEAKPAAKEATPPAAAAPKEAAPKPAPPPKAPVPTPQPWDSDLVRALRGSFPDLILEPLSYLGQNYIIVPPESILPIAIYMKTEAGFDMLADLTAVDYPKREKRFDVVYLLYSFPKNERLRLKLALGENEPVESVVPVWGTADWLEREAFDMFGIRFDHHPNLRRILLPDEWEGYPLRKDYGILQQDVKWVQENLHIESGQ